MYTAVSLANEVPGVVKEVVFELGQEEVVSDDLFCLAKFALGGLEVKLYIKFLEEGGDRILVLIFLHLDNFDDFTNRVADPAGDCAARCGRGFA